MSGKLCEELGRILSECGAKISFSATCRSGLVGREICQCWRCRGVEPEDEHPKWARAAHLISGGHGAEVRRSRRRV